MVQRVLDLRNPYNSVRFHHLLYGYALRVKLDVDPSLAVLFVMVLAVFVIPALPFMAYFSSFLEYDKRVVIH